MDTVPNFAVTAAVWNERTFTACTVKLEKLAPAGTTTEVGVLKALLLSDMVIRTPAAGAAPLSVTVQVLDADDFRVVGLQTKPVRLADATKVRVTR